MRVRPTQQGDRPPAPTSSLIFSVSTSITASRAVMSLRQHTHRCTRVCAGVCMTRMRSRDAGPDAHKNKVSQPHSTSRWSCVLSAMAPGPQHLPRFLSNLTPAGTARAALGARGAPRPTVRITLTHTAPLTWPQSLDPAGTCQSVRGWGCHAPRWPSAWWTYHIHWSPADRSACEPHPHHR